jgi:hypothetical protein
VAPNKYLYNVHPEDPTSGLCDLEFQSAIIHSISNQPSTSINTTLDSTSGAQKMTPPNDPK